MARKKGTVTKAAKSRFGYFLQLDGDQFYYNTKFEPKCGEGDVVGLEFTPKGDNRGQITKVKIFENNSGGYAKSNSESSSSGGGGRSYGGGSSNSGNRDDSIVWQHSQEMALSAASLLLAQDAYAVKGKPDEKRTQIEGLIDVLTYKFFADAKDPLKCDAYRTAKELEADEDGGSEPADDDWPEPGAEADDGDSWADGDGWED